MSTQMSKDVSCPNCAAAVKTQMFPGISAQEDPDLKARILDETLFDWECPVCGYRARLVYPCLYHDKDGKFMIYIVPNGNDCALGSVNVSKSFPQFEGIQKRVVSSLTQLKEKILIFEAGLDDLAVELAKLALADVAREKHGTVIDSVYFCSLDRDSGKIEFAFFLNGGTEAVRQFTRIEVYNKSLEIVKSVADGAKDDEFHPVDSETAREVLRVYREEV